MGASVRQKRAVIDKLYVDFKDYGFDRTITQNSYTKLVTNPVLPRTIKKTFSYWKRAIGAMERAYPDVFSNAAVQETVVETPKVEAPTGLDALSALKVTKPVISEEGDE